MIGKVLKGKYKIDSVIGTGGMSTVYKAHNIHTNENVAVKLLNDELREQTEFNRRFEREVKAGMSLGTHKNIVKLIDLSNNDDELRYLVLEYADGDTLKTHITKRGPFSERVAVNIARQILDGLEFAHEQNVIHRDMKPQNVIITKNGTVKICDFGVAVLTQGTKTFDSQRMIGSVHYISPECAKDGTVTNCSDLYSVGIIMYEMMTGRVPYDGDNSVAVALKHISTPMVQPRTINPSISPAMNDVIMKATAKDPEKRYKSAAEMKNDINRAFNEPFGTFAHEEYEEEPEKTEDNQEPNTNGIRKLGIALGSVIALIIVVILIVSLSHTPMIQVENLLGMTPEEAEDMSNKFGVNVIGYVLSDDYDEGIIAEQDPAVGGRIEEDSSINVKISAGKDKTVVPSLMGKTLVQATSELSKAYLIIGAVDYDESSTAPAGTVCKQSIDGGETVNRNSEVSITISGTAGEVSTVPDIRNKDLATAVKELSAFGFETIHVRYSQAESNQDTENRVISQNFNPGIEIDKSTIIELEISGTLAKTFSADRAYRIPIDEDDTKVVVTIDTGLGYELIVYSDIVDKGEGEISFTAHYDKEGSYDCIVYVNDEEYKRDSKVGFNYVG